MAAILHWRLNENNIRELENRNFSTIALPRQNQPRRQNFIFTGGGQNQYVYPHEIPGVYLPPASVPVSRQFIFMYYIHIYLQDGIMHVVVNCPLVRRHRPEGYTSLDNTMSGSTRSWPKCPPLKRAPCLITRILIKRVELMALVRSDALSVLRLSKHREVIVAGDKSSARHGARV